MIYKWSLLFFCLQSGSRLHLVVIINVVILRWQGFKWAVDVLLLLWLFPHFHLQRVNKYILHSWYAALPSVPALIIPRNSLTHSLFLTHTNFSWIIICFSSEQQAPSLQTGLSVYCDLLISAVYRDMCRDLQVCNCNLDMVRLGRESNSRGEGR